MKVNLIGHTILVPLSLLAMFIFVRRLVIGLFIWYTTSFCLMFGAKLNWAISASKPLFNPSKVSIFPINEVAMKKERG